MLHLESAQALALAIRTKRASATEVARAFLSHIEANNPPVNAVVSLHEELVMKRAAAADQMVADGAELGPLHGVPMTLKDACATDDMVTTLGVKPNANNIPRADAEIVRRLRAAGANIMGKTNVPMACLDWQCKSPIYGPSNNPWHLGHVPGGSSGGAAAALAMGFTPIEVGSDLGGSIRYPAHCCGVYGLRPTTGVISLHQMFDSRFPNMASNLMAAGPMTRDLDDMALLFRVLSGLDTRTVRAPERSQLRVAWSDQIGGVAQSSECQEIFAGFIAKLEGVVGSLEPARDPNTHKEIDVDIDACARLWGHIAGYDLVAGLPPPARMWPLRLLYRLSGVFPWALGRSSIPRALQQGLGISTRRYQWALTQREQLAASMADFLESVDVWITPCSPKEAIAHQDCGVPIMVDDLELPYATVLGGYLVPFTVMDHPMLVMPIGLTKSGLPVGAQVHARRYCDARLIEVVRVLAEVVGFDSLCPRARGDSEEPVAHHPSRS